MNKFLTFTVNIVFFTVVVLSATAVSTIAFTRKVNEYHKTSQLSKITGSVVKNSMVIAAPSRGFVKEIAVRPGDVVTEGTLLVQLDNEVLRNRAQVLSQFTDNVSAQTESQVALTELRNLEVVAPADGVIYDILVVEGTPVETTTTLVKLYTNEEVRILLDLSMDEYAKIKHLNTLKLYSARLNKYFTATKELVRPDVLVASESAEKTYGSYWIIEEGDGAELLLQNEDLEVVFEEKEEPVKKPIDYFIDFWNTLLEKPVQENEV